MLIWSFYAAAVLLAAACALLSGSRELKASALVVTTGWLAAVAFRALAPYGAFWGYVFILLAQIGVFYRRLARGAALSYPLGALFWLHVARLCLVAAGPFFLAPYWLMFILNRLFEAGLIVIIATSLAVGAIARNPEIAIRCRRRLDAWWRRTPSPAPRRTPR